MDFDWFEFKTVRNERFSEDKAIKNVTKNNCQIIKGVEFNQTYEIRFIFQIV